MCKVTHVCNCRIRPGYIQGNLKVFKGKYPEQKNPSDPISQVCTLKPRKQLAHHLKAAIQEDPARILKT